MQHLGKAEKEAPALFAVGSNECGKCKASAAPRSPGLAVGLGAHIICISDCYC